MLRTASTTTSTEHTTGTPLQYRAIVMDNAGHTRTSRTRSAEVPEPRITLTGPSAGSRVRGLVQLSATTDPDGPISR